MGSRYELRRHVEQDPPARARLIVYIDAEAPDEDPLEELRASGTETGSGERPDCAAPCQMT